MTKGCSTDALSHSTYGATLFTKFSLAPIVSGGMASVSTCANFSSPEVVTYVCRFRSRAVFGFSSWGPCMSGERQQVCMKL